MSMTPEQQRKKAMAEEESLRHLRYAQADGMKHGENATFDMAEPKNLDVAMYNEGKGEGVI